MQFDGTIGAPGTADEVMLKLVDVERMARCMPGAEIEGKTGDNTYSGKMVVAFGPKKLKFRGTVECNFDMAGRSGVLVGRGAAERAARVQLTTTFTVRDDPEAGAETPRVIIDLHSQAQLSGILASLAATGGAAIAGALLADFERNLEADLSGQPTATRERPVSAGKLAWQATRLTFIGKRG